ncbi:MAG: adenosylhomocysteinase [Coriobacteriales bacterium]|jgi:adenosylhomocysteinase|nr:adenosylhomocysteinase [Coriobacteriales bacterium]
MSTYEVYDIALAPSGAQKIAWVRSHMPLLRAIEERVTALPPEAKPLAGVKLSVSIHLEAKTAYLCQVLALSGASVCATGSNVLSTQDDVAAALVESGVSVFAVHGESDADYTRHIEMSLEHRPNILIDDGGDLVNLLHTSRPDLAEELWGGCEETTTGVIRLKALEAAGLLRFAMIAVNDARMKHLFDNRYGTGQSVWDSLMRNTNLLIATKTVVIAGYGWCGRGIALRAAALGASVIVTEVDAVKAIEARMDGHAIMPMAEAAARGDIFITATGCKDVITTEHMQLMRDDVLLCNAGHFNVEVDVAGLEALASSHFEARRNIEAYVLSDGRRINVIAEGKLVNIAAADGHPAEIMDLSFAVQYHSVLSIKEKRGRLEPRVIDVSAEVDELISQELLTAWGAEIDVLSPQQQDYLNSWQL